MSNLINNLNISNLFISQNSPFDSIEFCFLYATNPSFRSKTPEKQSFIIKQYRTSIGSQIQKILHSSTTSKKKTLIESFDKNLHLNFLNDTPLYKDFMFVIQTIVKSHKFIIAENKNFTIFDNVPLEDKDNIVIIHKDNESFSSVYYEENTFVFQKSQDFIQVIDSFHSDKNTKEIINLDDNLLSTEDKDEDEPVETKTYIVNDDDIEFEDIDDDLVIKYSNKSFLQTFSKEEQSIHIQNLLASSTTKHEHQSANEIIQIINKYKPYKQPLYNLHPTKVSSINKHFDDYETYIDNFSQFKEKFPNKVYIDSCYYQDEQQKSNNVLYHENVIRNSFTTVIEKLNNEQSAIDVDECISSIPNKTIDKILKTYKIDLKGSKNTICKALSSFNFLEETLTNKLQELDIQDIRDLVNNNNIIVPKSTLSKKTYLIRAVVKSSDKLSNMISSQDLQNVLKKHNLPFILTDEAALYKQLTSVDVLNMFNYDLDDDNNKCTTEDIEDPELDISISINTPFVKKQHLETFRSLPQDKVSFNAFYMNGDRDSNNFEIFDVNRYFNILKNIRKFLPINCKLYYFDDKIVEGRIVEILQNDSILKINTKDNTITYYNLNNYHDNQYYLYPNIYDGYKYQKSNIDKNILFVINNLDYYDILKFVSLSFQQFIKLYNLSPSSNDNIQKILGYFNIKLLDLDVHTFNTLNSIISLKDSKPTTVPITKKYQVKESIYEFLKFDNRNIADLHKMFNLHNTNYITILHNLYSEQYSKHSTDILDTKATFSKSTDILQSLPKLKYELQKKEELVNLKKQKKNIIEKNTDVVLTKRETETKDYLNNLKSILDNYSKSVNRIDRFYNLPHEKTFIPEKSYHKKQKTLIGSSVKDDAFVSSSDPVTINEPLPEGVNMNIDNAKNNELLTTLITIMGVKLTQKEIDFTERQVKNIVYPVFTNLKLQKNKNAFKNNTERNLWNHYINAVGFTAFFTLFTQYKYDIDQIYNSCKENFSLHGFPLDNDTTSSKSLTKYLSCILFNLFGKSNAFFQSKDFINSQLIASIRLILQSNPIIKQIFDTIPAKSEEKKQFRSVVDDLKPFTTYKHIDSIIEQQLNNKITTDFKIHKIFNNDSYKLLVNDHMLQHTQKKSKVAKIDTSISKLENVRTKPLKELTKLNLDSPNENDKNQLTTYVDDFETLLKITPKQSQFKNFVDTFIVKAKSNNINNYYYLFNINNLYQELMVKYEDTFTEYRGIFEDNLVDTNEKDITMILNNMFFSFTNVLETIFDTNDIKSHIYTEMDPQKKTNLINLVNEFKSYIDSILESYNSQFFNFDDLKNKAEILREEDKQHKMMKYDNMDDEMMDVYIKLEEIVGISLDIEQNIPSQDDIENDQINVLSQDDDIPE